MDTKQNVQNNTKSQLPSDSKKNTLSKIQELHSQEGLASKLLQEKSQSRCSKENYSQKSLNFPIR